MPPIRDSENPRGLARIFAWPRLKTTLVASALLGLLISVGFTVSAYQIVLRAMFVGTMALFAFGVFERWPPRLPSWLARWLLQVLAVAGSVPFSVIIIYIVITQHDAVSFFHNKERMSGFAMMTFSGLLFAPWIAVAALIRQRDFLARSQALAFELERSELERKALDARMRLLQAQVEPHFLFNTLANVRELVDSGSPQASAVLASLIAYLRAAVPRLHEPATTLGQELELVRAYLELMHMRMPDRLQYSLNADDAVLGLRCPPMTLLTLVENAVRHGIDPSEEGGRIDVRAQVQNGRLRVEVVDTGVGLREAAGGLGTGLSTLRERLQLAFGGDARLQLAPMLPHGLSAQLEFRAERGLP